MVTSGLGAELGRQLQHGLQLGAAHPSADERKQLPSINVSGKQAVVADVVARVERRASVHSEHEMDFSEVFEHGHAQHSEARSTQNSNAGHQDDVDDDELSQEVMSPVFSSMAYFQPPPGSSVGSAGLSDAPGGAPTLADAAAVLSADDGDACALEPSPSGASHIAPSKLGPTDFELLRVVGQGAFGKVFQVRKRDNGQIYAMKVMRKDRILEKDHGEYVRAERDVLTAVFHPYIVTLRYSFQTPHKLYLVLDFINGGHLFFQLYRQGIFNEELARLYTAEIVLAIAHLHSLGFVHRDLKPENVLLDSEGHIKVTDFGLAKGNMTDDEQHRTNSFIGTMEYMAPEVVQGKGHGKAVDWWSVGVLLYEMLCGVPPFRAKNRQALQRQITNGKLKLPPYLSSAAQQLLKALLTRDAKRRLGYGPTGSADIMRHAFFKPISWKALETRGVASPFRPSLRAVDSVENFDACWTSMPAHDSPCSTPREDGHWPAGVFDGFSYVAPSVLQEAIAAGRLPASNPAATS